MSETEKKETATAETEIETKTAENAEKKKEKKTDKQAAEIASLKEELAVQKDLLLRTAAEFDNYKRRTERESIVAAEYTKAALLKKLLPIFDNVERSKAYDSKSTEYAKGIELTVKQFDEAVKAIGMVEVGAEGEQFDPTCHEAVMHIEDDTLGENVICKVLQKGYKIGDTVIRPAMVQVAN